MHAADQIKIQPVMLFQFVSNALAIRNDAIIDAFALKFPDQRYGRKAKANDHDLVRYHLAIRFCAIDEFCCVLHGARSGLYGYHPKLREAISAPRFSRLRIWDGARAFRTSRWDDHVEVLLLPDEERPEQWANARRC